jgi:hypothetical protein
MLAMDASHNLHFPVDYENRQAAARWRAADIEAAIWHDEPATGSRRGWRWLASVCRGLLMLRRP